MVGNHRTVGQVATSRILLKMGLGRGQVQKEVEHF
jgi:hypothetical protein